MLFRDFGRCFALLLVALLATVSLAATDQPRSDRVVGYWVSSSGTPIVLAYSGRPETFLVQIQQLNAKSLSYEARWVSADGVRFTYRAADGATVEGWVHDGDRISVQNPRTKWRAEWKRR